MASYERAFTCDGAPVEVTDVDVQNLPHVTVWQQGEGGRREPVVVDIFVTSTGVLNVGYSKPGAPADRVVALQVVVS